MSKANRQTAELARLRQRVAELETERDFLRLTLMRAVVYAVKFRTGRYTPEQEADAYGKVLNTAEDAIGWTAPPAKANDAAA